MRSRIPIWRLVSLMVLGVVVGLAGWWFGWPEYQLWSAKRDITAGNLVRAEETLADLLRVVPNRADAQLLYAQVLRRLQRFSDAQTALGKAQALGLSSTQEGRREAALLEGILDFRRGEEGVRQFLEATPQDGEALQVLAEGYAKLRRWSEAEWAYSRWLEIEPQNREGLFGRAQVRWFQQQFQEAMADCRAVLDRSPEDFPVRLLLANCLLNEARLAEAEPELLVCQQLRPDRPEPLVGLAVCATGQGDLDKASQLLGRARELEPFSVLVLRELGDHWLLRQRYDLAQQVFSQVVRLDPRDKQAHLKLAQALRRNGQEELAHEHERRYQLLDAEEARQDSRSRRMR